MELSPRYIHAKCAVKNTMVEQWFIKSLQVTVFPAHGAPAPEEEFCTLAILMLIHWQLQNNTGGLQNRFFVCSQC